MRDKALAFLIVVCVCLLASCATPETITVTEVEYVPVTMDISASVDLLFDVRPELSPRLYTVDGDNLVQESIRYALTYKEWGESWQDYAIKLEDFLIYLEDALMESEI